MHVPLIIRLLVCFCIDVTASILVAVAVPALRLPFGRCLLGIRRDPARGVAPIVELLPIDWAKECMRLHGLRALGSRSEAGLGILLEKRHDDPACFVISKIRRDGDWLFGNLAQHVPRVVVTEGSRTAKHLVEEYASPPPIHRLVVLILPHDHFGCHVLLRAAERLAAFGCLRQTKISQPRVALFIYQDVLRLEVTIDDFEHIVEVGQGE
mmetsp:Transcript_16432/g.36770  ORF Transcript_16432/g.36770 Transcript_16432/m.36770 type:complete len:210 (-) Transcript_16432:273-902(-)